MRNRKGTENKWPLVDGGEEGIRIGGRNGGLTAVEDAEAVSLRNRLPAVADIELPVDVVQVSFDGFS